MQICTNPGCPYHKVDYAVSLPTAARYCPNGHGFLVENNPPKGPVSCTCGQSVPADVTNCMYCNRPLAVPAST